MYGMTPMGVFFTAIFPLKINEHALCQQLQVGPRLLACDELAQRKVPAVQFRDNDKN